MQNELHGMSLPRLAGMNKRYIRKRSSELKALWLLDISRSTSTMSMYMSLLIRFGAPGGILYTAAHRSAQPAGRPCFIARGPALKNRRLSTCLRIGAHSAPRPSELQVAPQGPGGQRAGALGNQRPYRDCLYGAPGGIRTHVHQLLRITAPLSGLSRRHRLKITGSSIHRIPESTSRD
jgi:hypothetical protein